ncbi:MAG: hypothetical protein LC793_21520 [Thermomicrobia bacterium]|nr:hypothetical protein [Thermomicrobia bacterium]MCA1723551.1 hypothetical protein [Thermomicrobia bacterium]
MAHTNACPIAPDAPNRCGQNPLMRYVWLGRVILTGIRHLIHRPARRRDATLD